MVFEEEGWVKLLYRVWGWVMVVIVGVGMMSMVCVPANGAVICVPGDASTIQAGIDLAVDGDTVRIGSGVWRGDGNRDIDVKGKQIVIESEAGPESCIIDIEGTEADSFTGFIIDSTENEMTCLKGITIKNGSGKLMQFTGRKAICGGAAIILGGSPKILNCHFIRNAVSHFQYLAFGGALYISDSSACVSNCNFVDNFASSSSGAISCSGSLSQVTIESSSFVNNSSGGGIVCCGPGVVTLQSCFFTNNRTFSEAGVVFISSDENNAKNAINSCTFIGNVVESGSSLVFQGRGGAVYCGGTEIVNCMFFNNSSKYGGAVYCYDNTLISNCVFYNNCADIGGAIYCSTWYYENCSISQSTFVNNISNSPGGAIYIPQLLSPITITNCIFRGNYPTQIEPSSGDPDELPDVTYCNVEGGYRGFRNIDVDPLFCSDGPDRFFLSQITSGQSQDSPCLNQGSTDASLACVPEFDPPICMDAFTTRTDRITDAGTVDMGFHYPPDWTGSTITGVRLWMPETVYHPGDPCACKVFVYNRDEQPLDGHALFVVLDILGAYYFAPSFTEYDSYLGDYPSFPIGRTEILVIPEFVWPTGTGSFSGAMFYAAMLDPTLTQVVGNWDWFQFGWGE